MSILNIYRKHAQRHSPTGPSFPLFVHFKKGIWKSQIGLKIIFDWKVIYFFYIYYHSCVTLSV